MHSTPIAPEKVGDPAAWQLRSTREEADAFVHDVMYKSMYPDDFAESVVKRYAQAAAGEAEDAEAEAAERIARISASVGDGGETTALLASLARATRGSAQALVVQACRALTDCAVMRTFQNYLKVLSM